MEAQLIILPLVGNKPWIIHEIPRYINIPGVVIRKQLVGTHPIDHELCSAIIRRINQIGMDEARKHGSHPWSCGLEPDFAIAALAGLNCPTLAHIRNQFISVDFQINACWLFHAPVPLHDGWCNVAFEMRNKIMHIMDPTSSTRGINPSRKKKLAFVAGKLHAALFNCINTFFADWPVDDIGWTKKFPILMDTNYSRDESGLCTTFFVNNFGGTDMKVGVSRDNIDNHRLMLLHQVRKIQGNSSHLAKEHLSASKIDDIGLL